MRHETTYRQSLSHNAKALIRLMLALAGFTGATGTASQTLAQGLEGQKYTGERLVSRAEYREKIRGMWLGQCIANWTGLQTEGRHTTGTFLTDAAWGFPQPYSNGFPLEYKWFFNPWWADDDTDIEYVYQHLMLQHDTLDLSPEQLAAGWVLHINRYIWVSNATARGLIGRGVLPPATSLASVNVNRLAIDAQLTTEFYGMFSPGMPGRAMQTADLPIRTTASGFAAHASQFYVALYALAPVAPRSMSAQEKTMWLVEQAREYIPDGSRASEIVDFVVADYLANADPTDWESTRDKLYQRYHLNAAANGYVYRGWAESAINFATGVMALVYGQGDYRQSVKIGTLSGWDSDNGTATMGGLLGLINGYDHIRNQFGGGPRENFWILRTRDNLPDYTGGADAFEDTFGMMADRVLSLIERNIEAHGGVVQGGDWVLAPVEREGVPLLYSPTAREDTRSVNNSVRRAGGTVTATCVAGGGTTAPPAQRGTASTAHVANGLETKFDGLEEVEATRTYFTTQGMGTGSGGEVSIEVTYDRPVEVHTIRFIEGDHFTDGTGNGGWFGDLQGAGRGFSVRGVDGVWMDAVGVLATAQDAARPFQILDYVLTQSVVATGIRVRGVAGGTSQFVTCGELDALSSPLPIPRQNFDVSGDGVVGVDDVYAWMMGFQNGTGVELDGIDPGNSGYGDKVDGSYMVTGIRLKERARMMQGRQ